MSSGMMMGMAAASTVMNMQAQSAQGDAALRIGQQKQTADEFQAKQLDINAGQAQAAGQISAINQDRNTSLVLSRARAVAAASGGGASDPTIIRLMANIAGEGAYRANVARYEGDTQARTMNMQAAALRYQGANALADAETAKSASGLSMVSTALSGGSKILSMGSKYGWGDSGGNAADDSLAKFAGTADYIPMQAGGGY